MAASVGPTPVCWCLTSNRVGKTGCDIYMCWLEEDRCLPTDASPTPLSAVHEAAAHCWCQDMLLAPVLLAVPRLWDPFCRAAPRPGSAKLHHRRGFFLPRCVTWHLPFLNFTRFLSFCDPSLPQSFWIAALHLSIINWSPPILMSSSNLMRALNLLQIIHKAIKPNRSRDRPVTAHLSQTSM